MSTTARVTMNTAVYGPSGLMAAASSQTLPADLAAQLVHDKKAVYESGQPAERFDDGGERRREIIRAAIANAANRNPIIAEPWSKAPTYAASAAYMSGECRRGTGGDAGNVYTCVKIGAAGSASAPTGTGVAGMIDGTTAWLYAGKGWATSTYPLYSTVTPAASTDVMNGYLAIVLDSARTTLGLTQLWDMNFGTAVARVTGGSTLISDGGFVDVQGPLTGTLAAGTRNASRRTWCFHFRTDCRKWLYIQPQTSLGQKNVYIVVDGRPLTEGDIGNGTAVSAGGWLLDVSAFGPGVHDIKVFGYNPIKQVCFRIYTGTDENVWKPESNGFKVALEGDSIMVGSGTGGYAFNQNTQVQIPLLLGADEFYNSAIGSTGIMNNASGTATTYGQRLADIAAMQPDVLVVGGAHNDVSQGTSAERQAAYLAYFQDIRTACPNTFVLVTGNQMLANESLTTTTEPSQTNSELDLLAAFNTWADANAKFLPLLTDIRDFPVSTGTSTWFYQSAGSSPFNDSHPTPRYYAAFCAKVAQAVREFFAVV